MPQKLKNFSNPDTLLIALLILYFLTHLYKISDPPNGYHAWRESDTAAVAEAFYKETKNIFQPRIHNRQDKSGITGMEFPLYNYVTGQLYHIFGFHHYIPRLIVVLAGLFALLGIYRLSRFFLEGPGALLASYLTACSPLFFFYSRKIMPDVIMVSAIIWSLYFFLKSEKHGGASNYACSLLLVTFAALIKPTGLIIGLPMLVFLISANKPFNAAILFRARYILFFLIAVSLPFAWYAYARHLQAESGMAHFFLGENRLEAWQMTDWTAFFKRIGMSWLFELFLGLPTAIALILGLLYSRKVKPGIKIFLWWILGAYLSFFAFTEKMDDHHDYYALYAIPPLTIVAAAYIQELLKSNKRFLRILAIILITGAAIYVWPRIHQRYDNFSEKDFFARRELIDRYIPADARITVEDRTPTIELYRAGRVGWTFPPGAGDERIIDQMRSGAKYAIFYQRSISEAIAERADVLYSAGGFTICRFKTGE